MELVNGSDYRWSNCSDGDLADLFEFQRRMHDGRSQDLRRVRWLFDENPCRPQGGRPLWICRRDTEIVSTTAGILFELQVNTETCRGLWGINAMVDPQWRGRGIAVGGARKEDHPSYRSSRIHLALGNSDAGHRVARRMGYVAVGTLPVYAFAVSPALVGEGTRRRWVRAARPLLPLAGWVTRRMAGLRSTGAELVPIEAFDEQADSIWERVSPAYPVIGVRDATRLRWRFDQCPHRDAYLRFYLRYHQQVAGYLVMRRGAWHGETAFTVVDYLAAPRAAGALFACAVAAARQYGAAALFCPTLNSRANRTLCSLGFFRLRGNTASRLMAFYADEHDPVRRIVDNPDNWFVTAADSDYDLPLLRPEDAS
jgi:hypothetical protein